MALEEAVAADRQDPAAASPQIAKEQYTADNLPAVFWDEYPQDSKNVDLAAINAILEGAPAAGELPQFPERQSAGRSAGRLQSEGACASFAAWACCWTSPTCACIIASDVHVAGNDCTKLHAGLLQGSQGCH